MPRPYVNTPWSRPPAGRLKGDDTRGTWLYTRDGDLDPLWLFLALHLALGVVLVVASVFHGKQAFLAALSYNAVSVLILAIIKVPIDRARLLAPALPKAMGALQAATSPPYAGMDQDERGPDDRDVTWD